MPCSSAHRVAAASTYTINPPHPSDNSTTMPEPNSAPILLDGSDNDTVLSNSVLMTRAEVIARRARRARQLARIYRDCYWALMEELKFKYRQYFWDHAKSPFVQDQEISDEEPAIGEEELDNNGGGELGTVVHGNSGGFRDKCGFRGCKANAMAMAKFCHAHILSDTEQTLYQACVFSVKSSNSGPRPCGKPTLRSVVPSYCSSHFQHAKNLMTCALRKGGLNVSSTSKLAPKFHSIVEEYVQAIQKKRKAAQRAGFMRKGNNPRRS